MIVGDKVLTDQDYELVKNSDRNFSLKLTWGEGREKITDRSLNGANVEVYYTATINEKTRLGREGNLNSARLRYSSNPNDSDDEEVTSWDYVEVFTYSLTLNKVDESDLALEGVEFKLEKRLADGTLRSIFVTAPTTFVSLRSGGFLFKAGYGQIPQAIPGRPPVLFARIRAILLLLSEYGQLCFIAMRSASLLLSPAGSGSLPA